MLDIIYTIIIWPLVQLIELIFVIGIKIFRNPVISLILISFAVSVMTLPLYFIAENFQKKERDLQKLLKPKIDKIKSAFKGDEQYMILSTFYKQNNYHPIYALRNSFSLFIQIPFFIAAYSFISGLELFHGVSFLFIKDLGIADGLLKFGNININVLPFIMTFFNLLSGFIYSIDLEKKDKIQILGIAIIFLILLYNSPAALVLYWTLNNIFSLLKNIIQNIIKYIFNKNTNTIKMNINSITSINQQKYIFIFTCIILFILHGLVVPSSIIASSVSDFSFIGSLTSPLPFILNTILQSAGIFLFWPLIIFFIISERIKKYFLYIMLILTGICMVNIFLITENFGFLSITLLFSDIKSFNERPLPFIINIISLLFIVTILFFLTYKNRHKIIISAQIITFIALIGFSLMNIINILNDFSYIKNQYESKAEYSQNYIPHFTFSKTGNNILLIMLDTFIGSFVPFIFEEKPELYSSFIGFHWYPNTVSFSRWTRIGVPPAIGGYEYTPIAINTRDNDLLIDKHKEAFLLLPILLSNEEYSVNINDPPFLHNTISNLDIYKDYPQINADNLIGKYSSQWLRDNEEIISVDIEQLLYKKLIRFSIFKSTPLFLRFIVFDHGYYFTLKTTDQHFTPNFINNFAFFDNLEYITDFREEGNNFNNIFSFLTHSTSSTLLQANSYRPARPITLKGNGIFAQDVNYHSAAASIILLKKWFNYLKENDVYDNTRIIIFSDHGRNISGFSDMIYLPDGTSLSTFNALLMIKDFNSDGILTQSNEFMTNADIPLLLLNGIIEKPTNPFTGIQLHTNKENGVMITNISMDSNKRYYKYTYNIRKNEWLFVKDNIFESSNWSLATFP